MKDFGGLGFGKPGMAMLRLDQGHVSAFPLGPKSRRQKIHLGFRV